MGMAASQANLLSITSRMHDIEYKAQNIESSKIELATQKDELYQDYCDKLDAKKIQVAYGMNGLQRSYVDATFGNVATYDPSRQQQYALRMADTGKVIVEQKVYEIFKEQGFNTDKYAFAWAMLGLNEGFSWKTGEGYGGRQGEALGINTDESNWNAEQNTTASLLMTDVEKKVFDENVKEGDPLYGYYEKFLEADKGENKIDKYDAFHNFRSQLYSQYGKEIYQYMILDKSDPNNTDINGVVNNDFKGKDWADVENEFNYYTRLFEEISNAGGCVSVDEIAGGGETNNEWFNSMVTSGRMLIDMWVDNKNGWTETSVATCSTNNYLQEVSDEADLKKAEAEYEYELGLVNAKDKKFDKELSKLETERNALNTEMEAIKKVKEDNIKRTFGIFS